MQQYHLWRMGDHHSGYTSNNHVRAILELQVWIPQHEASGRAMYELCVNLRGFYLKVKHFSAWKVVIPCICQLYTLQSRYPDAQAGQFIGSRSDFVPEQICRHLALLCDRVSVHGGGGHA